MARLDAAAAALALRSAFSCCTARRRSRALSSSEAVKDSAGPSAKGKQLVTVLKQCSVLTTCAINNHQHKTYTHADIWNVHGTVYMQEHVHVEAVPGEMAPSNANFLTVCVGWL